MYRTKTKIHPAAIALLTDATWEFAHSILWDNFPFSEAEANLSKTYIREYYEAIPPEQFGRDASRHFTGYCERILLARNYVSRFPWRYIPHPCIWLNRCNPKGFAGTKQWYDRLKKKRRKQAEYARMNFHLRNELLNRFAYQSHEAHCSTCLKHGA